MANSKDFEPNLADFKLLTKLNLSSMLEEFREKYGFTHTKLAEIIGISKNSIPRYLYGETYPPGNKLNDILLAMKQFGIPEDKILKYALALHFQLHKNSIKGIFE